MTMPNNERIEAFRVVYECDGAACGPDHDCGECRHTGNIRHAKNFERYGEYSFMEVIGDGRNDGCMSLLRTDADRSGGQSGESGSDSN